MPLRFQNPGPSGGSPPPAANDNPFAPAAADFTQRLLLREALRHLAAHGPAAADVARIQAEQAFFAGDRCGYLRWLGICRALDRRMVDTDR